MRYLAITVFVALAFIILTPAATRTAKRLIKQFKQL